MRFDIEQLMDGSRLGPLHWRVLILCAVAAFLDGYDIGVMASATPSLAAAWHMNPGDLRWVVTAAVLGIAASALLVSPLGDYVGRRAVLLTAFAVVGISTLAASTANTPTELFVWRFLTGIGLGASLPNALALGAEYAPVKSRTALVALLACGITLGSAASGLVAPPIIESGGWRALFITGGCIALVAWLPLFALPESLHFLVARGGKPEKVGRLLERLDREHRYTPGDVYTLPEKSSVKLTVSYLLTPRLAPATLLLWLVFFLNLGLLYLMSTWLSTLLHEEGLPLPQALRIAAMFQIGGVAGGFGLAWLMQRWGPYPVLSVSYALTAAALALLGTHVTNPVLLVILMLIAGNGILGSQAALNAVSATLYPTPARATGVGWALGVGRFGAIVGPFVAGSLMAAGIELGHLFWLAVIPTLMCALAVTLLRLAVNRSARAVVPAA
jgi:AAHS family 4-hydroxybenzoate transporter-like MFS transporter